MTDGPGVLARCAELDAFSAHADRLERLHLTPEHAAAHARVADWFTRAGLTVRQDAAGNLVGRREGRSPDLPVLVIGSHTDTVPDAGSFDGMLGVALGAAAAERLAGTDLPFALEVVAFSDEEGARFGTALMGSRAFAGTWDDSWWDRTDPDGVTVRDAFLAFGLDPDRVGEAARDPRSLLAYLEVHIEQGPYLEAADRPLGVVTSIAGARRLTLTVHGEARHAGGTPFERRRDALAGAAELVLLVERMARESGDLATVGRLVVSAGAVNVIPGEVTLTVDVRARTDDERDALWHAVESAARDACRARGLGLDVMENHRAASAPCAPRLQDVLAGAARGLTGVDAPRLWSPAGHDAMALAEITDVAVLFVRCRDGISHHPDESVQAVDVGLAVDALEAAILKLAEMQDGSGLAELGDWRSGAAWT